MGSKWWKQKVALGSNSSDCFPRTSEEASPSVDTVGRFSDVASHSTSLSQVTRYSDSKSTGSSTQEPSSSGLQFSNSGSETSKRACAICLGTTESGDGHALFTAECSHVFHFHCITLNVKHGNQICPVCRAKWNEIPLQGPTLDVPHREARINPVDWPQDNVLMTVLRPLRPTRAYSSRSIEIAAQTPEPCVFNDDEPLDHQPDFPIECSSTKDAAINISIGSIEIETYPEVSAIQRSTSQENFDVLIHLKGPVHNARNIPGRIQENFPPSSQISRAPIDLVTVLDVSGSMAGTKLALLKRAMGFVIQNLGPSDRLSVIAFSSTARRLFPLCRMTESGRLLALQAVNAQISNGGTNISEALKKGAKVMEDRREKNPVGSMILLSDGHDTFTVGGQHGTRQQPNYQSLLPISVRGGGNSGFCIPVHAFGFGADHDAALMHSISESSGGTFSFIEAQGVIQDAFAQCIGGLLSVVVQDLRVGVECVHPDVRLGPLKAGSYATCVMNDARTGFIDAGDLYADEERNFLVTVNVPVAGSSNETSLVKVQCVYRDPISKESITLEGKEVMIKRPEIARDFIVSIEVDSQRNRLQAAEAMAEARNAAEQGDLASAVSVLESCRRALSETMSARSGDQLCVALDAELREMQERMASRRLYEVSGRAYVLSGLSSHSWQRATARGDSTYSTSLIHAYRTPFMDDMLNQSQSMLFGVPSSRPPVRLTQSFPVQLQPRSY